MSEKRCVRCDAVRRQLVARRDLCRHCFRYVSNHPVLLSRYPQRGREQKRRQLLQQVIVLIADDVTTGPAIAHALGIRPETLRGNVRRWAKGGDPYASIVWDTITMPPAEPTPRISIRAQQRDGRLSDALEMAEHGERTRSAIASRLGLTEAALERFLYRCQRAGDQRARLILSATCRNEARRAS